MVYTLLEEKDIAKNPYTRIVISKTCSHHVHTFFEFTICTKGSYLNCINDEKKTINQGRIMLLRPQDHHYFVSDGTHTFRDVYIMPSVMESICNAIDPNLFEKIQSTPLLIDFSIPEFQLRLLENKLNYLNEIKDTNNVSIKIRHRNIVMEILDLWQQYSQNSPTNMPEWLSFFITQLGTEQNIGKTVEELIVPTHYSHGYVCREFKKYMGKTLQNYINELRFAYALSLLAGDASISEIAEKLNYSDTSNFIFAFKNNFGITPKQWRNNQ